MESAGDSLWVLELMCFPTTLVHQSASSSGAFHINPISYIYIHLYHVALNGSDLSWCT